MSYAATEHPLRILVVSAHPHDFTAAAGTCGRHITLCDSVTVVAATGGARLHNDPLESELHKPKDRQDLAIVDEATEAYGLRKGHELHDACAVFGITDVRVLPFRDVFLEPSAELDQTLADIILEIRPDVLITHAPFATPVHGHASVWSSDHRTTGIAVQRACSLAATPNPQSGLEPHRIAKTFYFGIEWSWNEWDLIVDITDQVTRCVEAQARFKTQGHYEGYALKNVQVWNGVAGWYGGFAYGEAFLTPRFVLSDHLPVTEVELCHARRPTMDELTALGTRVEDLM